MHKTLYLGNDRGFANHGWLRSYHTFSFANYFRKDRMSFGTLRVFNDDFVEPGMGFGTHQHDNMEIISIPIQGTLAHKDNQGNVRTLNPGDIQVMSAGTGITHSEYNLSDAEPLNFLQLWIIPSEHNIKPSYMEGHFQFEQDMLLPIVRPDGKYASLAIKQDAYIYLGKFSKGTPFKYCKESKKNGIFMFLIEGEAMVEDEKLHQRDAIGIENQDAIRLDFLDDTYFILLDIPMK